MPAGDTPRLFTGYFASPLRYPGGKGRLGPWLATLIEANNLRQGWYVEPYAGGAGAALYLLLHNVVERILINDADPLIYAFWRSVVHDSEAFIALVETTPVTMESREACHRVVTSPGYHTLLELGFAAFFLNRTSRSGILAGGAIGGKDQAGTYKLDARYNVPKLVARIRAIAERKDQITVFGLDALDLLTKCSPHFPSDTLIYMDPPYYVKGSQLYRNHYQHADHEAIAAAARAINHPLLITYDECIQIRRIYEGMRSSNFTLQYSTHLRRPMANEVLFYANLTLPTSPQLTRGAQLRSRRRVKQAIALLG